MDDEDLKNVSKDVMPWQETLHYVATAKIQTNKVKVKYLRRQGQNHPVLDKVSRVLHGTMIIQRRW